MISTKRSHRSRDASYWCTLPRSILYRSLYTRRCKSNCHLCMLWLQSDDSITKIRNSFSV